MQALDIASYPGDFLILSAATTYMNGGYAATYATIFVIRHCLFLRRMLLLRTLINIWYVQTWTSYVASLQLKLFI